jgi:hypothetical protein
LGKRTRIKNRLGERIMIEIRWLQKKDGERILQYRDLSEYVFDEDGYATAALPPWRDVPVETDEEKE